MPENQLCAGQLKIQWRKGQRFFFAEGSGVNQAIQCSPLLVVTRP
ncbi:hypothetical protein AC24_3802 [Escherichia coli 8-415-05_S3_C2]|nr:hypothetical protein AD07_3777 [Escherichia coli 8-415-05_S4_C2]KEN31445.1 hypothetical protein AC54_3798 [Escherichia coli 8-415-05_S3_C3]KEN37927.1 hypothetical protein AB96_3854 [Escherichia coli 8-415-05_S3_C1]KEN69440.1 hypothetical protein AC24_3802 [Escherichia coli 8-415-05_S3_C2]CCQ04862.1 FIG00641090: hypothetical protein [Escherichia coli Nissle 1917]